MTMRPLSRAVCSIDVPKLRWSPAFPRRVRVDKTDTNLPGRGGCRRNTANVRQPARSSTSVSPAAPTPFFAPKRHSAPVGAITKDGNHMNTAPVPSATFGTRFFLEIDVPRTTCRCPLSGQVISISAVRDEQIAFEGGSGHSMTSALIDMLRQEPNPSYPKLLEFINAWWCKSSIRMRSYFKERQDSLEEKKKHAKPDELLDIERDLQVVTNCMNSKQVAMVSARVYIGSCGSQISWPVFRIADRCPGSHPLMHGNIDIYVRGRCAL
ncbi:hypothetical protein DFH11DRAFT_1570138 [Phellopilus nigrolimitatus]|nr:hypothetical protein DFH11DRAFT_1570138 [Phellopilus nigrolimitatus]